ncbi:protein of unknown function [Filimonas lacunae]|uniref:GH141-like insertion domain-containing protein n=1 Tax=Filimonas lacunae TaxID=477680 RepID=A0A173MCC2_9BACT|nr:L-rhamnose mutarotase [Filimonas lacunae]BAV05177.1 hypothetical protein FLA_1184 [Filimonas lacunae]SIT22783.1 protein of unknown function [Filimonas lacunae]
MNKRCFLLLAIYVLLASALHADAADIFVSIQGNDTYDGTAGHPKATLQAALRLAREWRRLHNSGVQGGIHIIVQGGTYRLYDPVLIRPEDSGTPESPTIIEAAAGEQPIISGGITINGWKRAQQTPAGLPAVAKGKVWVAPVPATGGVSLLFRQLWVNNRKATRARYSNGDSMCRIISWNHATGECWIPTPATPSLQQAAGVEMLIHQWWAIANLRVKAMLVQGDSTKLSFEQPESIVQNEHPWPAPWQSTHTGNSAFYLTNAIQFLDEPGEWYLDVAAGQLYYWPRADENLLTQEVVAPVQETLVKVSGTIDNPVGYVQFKGIAFEHTSWLRPSLQGHVPLQAGMYMLDAYKLKVPGTPDKKGLENQAWIGRPPAAAEVMFAHDTRFEGCRFRHLASTGLDYKRGTRQDDITGNVFSDIGGTGIQVGVYSDEPFETHLPYLPVDNREVCSYTNINNNLVTDVTNEDWGTLGISAGYVKNITIEHNEVSEVSYSGISVGWGWTRTVNVMQNNRVLRNKIHHYGRHMYDVAAIYTLSAQPGSVISENYIDSIYKAPYAHLPAHWFYLYSDEGTAYYTVNNNWCPAKKFLQNANGPNNNWFNNGPQVTDSVKQLAGLQPAYRSLLCNQALVDNRVLINSYSPTVTQRAIAEKPVIIEMVTPKATKQYAHRIQEVLNRHAAHYDGLQQWKNHYVVFAVMPNAHEVVALLKKAVPDATVTLYDSCFYVFDRSKCDSTTVAEEWEHTLLTANLVADTALQQQYLQYHATQYSQWPELAKGFCHARFQQLLLYRNGRQLMLVISIPKGEKLDNLNPKTTENNPRVVEWNTLMKKYQEGIAGTAPGEVWVELK